MMKTSFKQNRAFTLVELLVCVIIITIFSAALLGSRGRYSERLVLKNQAYNLALYLRQAQVYSLGVKGFKKASNPIRFDMPYGISFDMGSTTSRYNFFTDENADGKFQISEANEMISLSNNVTIQKICGLQGGSEQCSTGGALVSMAVTFKRPEPSAIIKFLNSGGNEISSFSPPAKIYLISETSATSSIKIDSTGGISVQ